MRNFPGSDRFTKAPAVRKLHMRDDALIRVFTITAALLGSATAAGADLLTACASEVTEFCADVDEGYGRVVACLASRSEELRAGCLSEVQAAAQSPLVPEGARRMFDATFRATLPPACEAAATSLCPGVMPGDGRVFACLYARASRVGDACSAEVQATVKAAD
jgi:hypothetical protein